MIAEVKPTEEVPLACRAITTCVAAELGSSALAGKADPRKISWLSYATVKEGTKNDLELRTPRLRKKNRGATYVFHCSLVTRGRRMLTANTKLKLEPRIGTLGRVSHLTYLGLSKALTRDRDKQGPDAQRCGDLKLTVQEFPFPVCLCFSVSKSKELSPGSGQKGSPGSIQGTACPGTQLGPQPAASPSQLPADQSPHTLRKGRFPLQHSQARDG